MKDKLKKLVKQKGRITVCYELKISESTLIRYLKTGIPNCKRKKIEEYLGRNQ